MNRRSDPRTRPEEPGASERTLEERHHGVEDADDAADFRRSRAPVGPPPGVALDGGVASEGGTGRAALTSSHAKKPRDSRRRRS